MKSVTFPDLNTTRLTEPMLEHEVRLRAYERYQRRGRVDGHALEDWLQGRRGAAGLPFFAVLKSGAWSAGATSQFLARRSKPGAVWRGHVQPGGTPRQWWWPWRPRFATGVAPGRVHCGTGRLVGPQVATPSASERQYQQIGDQTSQACRFALNLSQCLFAFGL